MTLMCKASVYAQVCRYVISTVEVN